MILDSLTINENITMEGTFDNLNENVSLKFNNDTVDIIKNKYNNNCNGTDFEEIIKCIIIPVLKTSLITIPITNIITPTNSPNKSNIPEQNMKFSSTYISISTNPIISTTIPIVNNTNPIISTTIPIVNNTNTIISTTISIISNTNPIISTIIPIINTTMPTNPSTITIFPTTIPILPTTIPNIITTIPIIPSTTPIIPTNATIMTTTNPILSTTNPIIPTTIPILPTTISNVLQSPLSLTTFPNTTQEKYIIHTSLSGN